jgi:hypothetical protein
VTNANRIGRQSTLMVSRVGLLLAGWLACWAPHQSHGAQLQVDVHGVLTSVAAAYPSGSPFEGQPLPPVDPAFAARFSVGEPVDLQLLIDTAATDAVPVAFYGQYFVGDPGSISIDGAEYGLYPGMIRVETEPPAAFDRYTYFTLTEQPIVDPVTASSIWVYLTIEGHDLLGSDALVSPPSTWAVAGGLIDFATSEGVVQRLLFQIQSVDSAIVPEPLSVSFALLGVLGVACIRRKFAAGERGR